jgi:hypothetical protein
VDHFSQALLGQFCVAPKGLAMAFNVHIDRASY